MDDSAHTEGKPHVLITEAGSFLGSQLIEFLLEQNCSVYGIGKSHLPHKILSNKDFTLLEIDLSQPIPSYLPSFEIIYDLSPYCGAKKEDLESQSVSPLTINLIQLASKSEAKLLIFSPIRKNPEFYENIKHHYKNTHNLGDSEIEKQAQLLLVGDLYGPNMPLEEENELASLIRQAIQTDKVILEDEGLRNIYPTHIKDAVFGINRISFDKKSHGLHFIASEPARTALTVSYEIQNAIRIVAGKEIGLFYAGPEAKNYSEPEISIKNHNSDFSPKFHLKHELEEIFASFQKEDAIKENKKQVHTPYAHKKEQENMDLQMPQKLQQTTIHTQKTESSLKKIPRFHFRYKIIFLVLFASIVLTIAKLGKDLFFGNYYANKAKQNAQSGNFQDSSIQALKSSNSYSSAKNITSIIMFPASLIAKNQTEAVIEVLEAASTASKSASYFASGAQSLKTNFSIIANPQSNSEGFNLEDPSADFKKAYVQSAKALNILENAEKNVPFKSKIENAKNQLKDLNSLSNSAFELTNLTENIIGNSDKRTYLVLLQNNTELRPGGGFIGNFALVNFDGGKLQDISVEDIYTIDGQLKEKIEPPQELKDKLGVDNLYLRDSNWSLDFGINAKTARDFFKKETGKDVDGVIAVDLIFIQNVLSKIGPITLTDYNEQISADNLFEKGEYYSEVGFFPGSTQKRDFFGALTRALITKIIANLKGDEPSNSHSIAALIESASDALHQKHMLVSFDDTNLASFTHAKNWDNSLPPANYNPADDSAGTRDFLALSEANLGANKVNRQIERKISYDMTIGKDADLVATLKITYTNNSQADTWPGGNYRNFLRVYTPFASGLLEYQNGIANDIEEVKSETVGNLNVFSTFVEVPIKSQKEVVFKYRIPKNIKLETAPKYKLYVQKQPGTLDDAFTFTFNLPSYLSVQSINGDKHSKGLQNISQEFNLSQDQKFEIELSSK